MREIQKIELRQLEISDFKNLTESMKAAYENWSGGWWDEQHIQKLIDIFPEGQLVIVADDEIAGCALSLIVDYDKFGDNHTYAKITGNYTFSTHDPNGDVIYGIEVFIKPDFRGRCFWWAHSELS